MTGNNPNVLSEAAERVQLEIAMETIAEYIGLFNMWITHEEAEEYPNQAKIDMMEAEIASALQERKSLDPDNPQTLHKALYVYAPLLKATRMAGK